MWLKDPGYQISWDESLSLAKMSSRINSYYGASCFEVLKKSCVIITALYLVVDQSGHLQASHLGLFIQLAAQ